MEEITLQDLLEAGCHFGHKAERWHPKAADFIWTEKDGVHIVDLAKTKAGLEAGASFVRELGKSGGTILFVGTKRQAKGVVTDLAQKAGAAYLTQRWIGGFLTNWEGVHKNIQKINRLAEEQATNAWKKFPKHERTKLGHYLARLKVDYGGVLELNQLPDALFIVDVKKEATAVREAVRAGIPIVGIVDTNSDPTNIDYVIAANDDAVGSIEFIARVIAEAYREGKEKAEKEAALVKEEAKVGGKEEAVKTEEKPKEEKPTEKKKKRKA